MEETEITHQKQELRESDFRFRALFEACPLGIFLHTAEGAFLQCNAALTAMLGYSPEELAQNDYTHPDDIAGGEGCVQELRAGTRSAYRREKRYIRKDGQILWAQLTGAAIHNTDGTLKYLMFLVEDITERKGTEEALQRSEERYRQIVETANEGVWVIDADSRTTFVNQRMAEMLDYTAEEMQGRHLFDFMDDQGRAITKTNLERRRQGIAEQHYFQLQRKDGAALWVLVSANPLYDASGVYAGALAMITDMTERRQLEEQLLQAQKMEGIGRLAGGVAHDFNNLLTAILGYTELALMTLSDTEETRAYLKQVEVAGERAADLTRQLLAFARKQIIEPQIVDLNTLTLNLDKMLRRLIGEHIELVTRPGADLGPVRVDPGQMEQVLVNLCVNARDAMPQGGKLTLETVNITLDEDYARHHAGVEPGAYVMLAVSDTGEGMDEAVQRHIFEPFFTTKEMGKGTGLGLATCHGIVKQNRGHIWLYSEPGHGTCFKIYLPRVVMEAEVVVSAPPREAPRSGKETILLVEDEPMVRHYATDALRAKGYQVLAAGSGSEAFQLARDYPDVIHLLMTDVVMPQMSGKRLAERLLEIRPGLKVLYASGYTDNTIVEHGVLEPGVAFLQKPYTPGALAKKVRDVLESDA